MSINLLLHTCSCATYKITLEMNYGIETKNEDNSMVLQISHHDKLLRNNIIQTLKTFCIDFFLNIGEI